jgi:CPA1 family monovalent cation:H+ antiporter
MDEGLFFVGLLGIGVVVTIVSRRFEIPYTVALVAAGLALGAVHPAVAPRLTHQSLYLFFLPGLIYEGALHLDTHTFLANRRIILLLAVPGTAIAAVLAAAVLTPLASLLGVHGVRPVAWILFATLISATDPTAVVALFNSLGLPKRLNTIVEGESLLNDATAIVMFSIALEVAGGARFTFGRGAIEFLRVVSLGTVAGATVATLVTFVARYVTDSVGRAALTVVAAYGSFLVAERLHLSGIVATLVCALMTAHAGVAACAGAATARWSSRGGSSPPSP